MDDRTLMQRLLDDGYPAEEIYHHGSDLYVYVTNKTTAVIRRWMKDNGFASTARCCPRLLTILPATECTMLLSSIRPIGRR